jgi:hypothetical protein
MKVTFESKEGWLKKVQGTVIVQATPVFDSRKQMLSFKDIDFTADTKSTIKGAAFQYSSLLLKPILLRHLQQCLVLNVAPILDRAQSEANVMVGRLALPPPLHLNFNLERLEAQTVAVYGNILYADFEASGACSVKY